MKPARRQRELLCNEEGELLLPLCNEENRLLPDARAHRAEVGEVTRKKAASPS